jgi:hypothetical protein
MTDGSREGKVNVQHTLKDYPFFFQSQRKAENESEVRRKAESILQDLKRKLEEEQNKRTREMNNNQQVNDKINVLEKQVL